MKTKKKFPVKNVSMPKKQNPFEVHINRAKYEVLGRKLKSEHGLPGVSKHKALQKRKATLLQEYKWKGKANQFIDSRIGERNSAMTEDDRIMARFAAERKKMYNKKTMFNLAETEVLTHRGQTLSEIEKFEETRSDDEDPDDTGALRGRFVSDAHFGGGVLSQGKKDRESIINQLIIESNKRIAERKRNKEETLEATEQLDKEWKTLGTIVTAKPKDEEINTKKNDTYDLVMRQLKFEPQAQASQRLKTDEEIAKEERETLEKLEKERLKMIREMEALQYGNHRSADDLDDGFSNLLEVYKEDALANNSNSDLDESDSNSEDGDNDDGDNNEMDQDLTERGDFDNDGNKDEDDVSIKSTASVETDEDKSNVIKRKDKKKTENLKTENENNMSSVKDSPKKDKSVKKTEAVEDMETSNNVCSDKSDSETTDDENDAMEDLTDLMPTKKEKTERKKQQYESENKCLPKETDVKENRKQKKKLKLDLPYVLNVPDDYDSFKQLLSAHSAEEQDVIFERIIKSNHPNLKPDNKKKMLNLAEYVLELLDKELVSWATVLVLVKHWTTLREFNTKECLLALADSIKSKVDLFEPDEVVHSPELDCAVRYLVWYSLLVAQPRGVEVLLPLSKPVMSLVCKHLSNISLRSWQEIPIGILLCQLLLKDAEKSSTLYTEGISFLHRCIKESVRCEKCHKQRRGPLCKCDSNETDDAFEKVTEEDLVFRFDNSLLDGLASRDPRILYFAVIILSGFLKTYRKFPQCKILFNPVHVTFKRLKVQNFAPPLKKAITDMQELLQVLQRAEIPALMKISKKPKALRQYEPCFYTVTASKTHRGLPAEKQEEQRLLHKYKHEMKGAMRELRRDRQFLANVKLREKVQSDEQRMRKVKEIFGSAAAQQGELRQMKRKK